MSEDSLYTTETVTESVQDNVNQVNSDYIALGLVGVFLLGCLVGLFVFRVFSSRWHTCFISWGFGFAIYSIIKWFKMA